MDAMLDLRHLGPSGPTKFIFHRIPRIRKHIPSGRNQSHVGRVRFPLWAKMHGRAHITDSCFIAFITSKIC